MAQRPSLPVLLCKILFQIIDAVDEAAGQGDQ
jgi:hypothetical protein